MRIGALYPVERNVKGNTRIQNLNILMSAPSHRTASRGPSLCVLLAPFDAAAVSGEKYLKILPVNLSTGYLLKCLFCPTSQIPVYPTS